MSIPRTRFQPRLATIPRIRRLGIRALRLPVLLLPMLGSGGCETASSTGSARYEVQAPPPPRPIALVGRERVTIAEIEPQLLEAVGGRIVRERVLDARLAREAAREGIEIDADDLQRERNLLTVTLAEDPDRAERLLDELRRNRGLGPIRFEALLRRTALLRRLVAEEVEITDAALEGAHDLAHGPRRVARIVVVEDLRAASDARRSLDAGTPFATVAVERSLDASADRGGLLAPVSRLDPSWPVAFRRAVFDAEIGRVSEPVRIDARTLLILVEAERPGTGVSLDAARDDAEAAARLAIERLLMDRLARRLVPENAIDPIDPSLRWSMPRGE
ncbi:MAG: peptidylprolyl isomerase [Planctomycetota bacterium]